MRAYVKMYYSRTQHNDETAETIRNGILSTCLNNIDVDALLRSNEPSERAPQEEGLRCVSGVITEVAARHGLEEDWNSYQTRLNTVLDSVEECQQLSDPLAAQA